jgi:hypothetical protein
MQISGAEPPGGSGGQYPADFVGPLGPNDTRSRIPELPPGVDINANIEAARGQDVLWFQDQVRNDGPWDYKQQRTYPGQYEAGGNFNYGATGRALGLSERFLLREAGRAQQAAGTSLPEWGSPGSRWNPWGGSGSFGDDPGDQYWIRQGSQYYESLPR